jgi:hypothetical protein
MLLRHEFPSGVQTIEMFGILPSGRDVEQLRFLEQLVSAYLLYALGLLPLIPTPTLTIGLLNAKVQIS